MSNFFRVHWREKKRLRREDSTPTTQWEVLLEQLGADRNVTYTEPQACPVAPGALIQAMLDDGQLTQSELAQLMRVERSTIHRWIHALRDLTPENAIALQQTLGIPAHVLLRMQADYNLFITLHPEQAKDPVARHSTL